MHTLNWQLAVAVLTNPTYPMCNGMAICCLSSTTLHRKLLNALHFNSPVPEAEGVVPHIAPSLLVSQLYIDHFLTV